MSYFADLTPYCYLPSIAHPNELNIGWLDDQHEFPMGEVPEEVLSAIFGFCRRRGNQTRGYHFCQLCRSMRSPYTVEENGVSLTLGSAEIRVPGCSGIEYACPDLIYHYIRDHRYRPPEEFIDALLRKR